MLESSVEQTAVDRQRQRRRHEKNWIGLAGLRHGAGQRAGRRGTPGWRQVDGSAVEQRHATGGCGTVRAVAERDQQCRRGKARNAGACNPGSPCRGTEAALDGHARRPRCRPRPRMAREFAGSRCRVRQHAPDRPAGPGRGRRVAYLCSTVASRGCAHGWSGLRRCRQSGQCRRTGAIQNCGCRQRRLGASVGTASRRVRRYPRAWLVDGRRSGCGRRQHDRVGTGRLAKLGHSGRLRHRRLSCRPSATS